MRKTLLLSALLALATPLCIHALDAKQAPHHFEIGSEAFLLDGKPFEIRCGEVHAPRIPREYWRHRLKMVKAMGLNTVSAYLFWNMHEPRPGQFNWEGQADAAEFCRIAQEEGLWVILRPGPYACAEWEMGGLPWWLLKHDDIALRSRDPRYLAAVKSYLNEVGRVMGPHQVSKGGNILMVQVENEYGFYGTDAAYMGELREALLSAGFEVPLFACNPKDHLKDGFRADLFPVVNFGTDPTGAFKALREILPNGPLMCGEFYPGWFDTWGAPHHLGNTPRYLKDLRTMLELKASFSIYMVHGGTSFGFYTGADRPFKPDTSSYDYDAPISEAGWITPKFDQTRALLAEFSSPQPEFPAPPPPNPVIGITAVEPISMALLFENLPPATKDASPRTMELYDQDFGSILYRTTLPAGPSASLEAKAIHDIGQVFLDGKRVGYTDRRSRNYRVDLPARDKPATLDVFVEAMGRVNFGQEVHDRKGIHGPITLSTQSSVPQALENWQVYSLPFDADMLGSLKFTAPSKREIGAPALWRVEIEVDELGDTFLDMRSWGKGMVWVNGHNLGRYWNIGPQQTMYLPGPWLKKGKNEILVLDLLGKGGTIAGLKTPILDQLRPELDFAQSRRKDVSLAADFGAPAHAASFTSGSNMQEVNFAQVVKGRYFCLETVDAHDGKPFASAAEVTLLDGEGKALSTQGWTIAYVDSEERAKEDGSAENIFDGQTANYWHSQWGDAQTPHPHRVIIDMGSSRTVSGLRYVPRQGAEGVTGRIKQYRIFVSDGLVK